MSYPKPPAFIVLTGGPGAGKTAALEVVRKTFCDHVAVLPEAASIVFGGGFPRASTDYARASAQRVIFTVQRELERLVCDDPDSVAKVACCDRATLDGLAYYPGHAQDFLRERGTTLEDEIARYTRVIHLRPPRDGQGYDHSNPLRVETAAESRAIDARLEAAWASHPRRTFVESSPDFLEKVAKVIALVREELPAGCQRGHTGEP